MSEFFEEVVSMADLVEWFEQLPQEVIPVNTDVPMFLRLANRMLEESTRLQHEVWRQEEIITNLKGQVVAQHAQRLDIPEDCVRIDSNGFPFVNMGDLW